MTRANVQQNSLVLDSGATIHFFSNEDLLYMLREMKESEKFTIHCGGRSFKLGTVGKLRKELQHLPLPKEDICLYTDGVANLLSMSRLVKEGYRIQMDSDIENAINVFNEDGSYVKFRCADGGLYLLDIDDSSDATNIFFTTVAEEKGNFSPIDSKRAEHARYIQKCLCLPSDVDFGDALDKGSIQECGIDRRHIKIANIIWGPAKASIEGKTVQRTNKMPRESGVITHVPPTILERYGDVTLGVDVLHINGKLFMIGISKHIKYYQCVAIRNKSAKTFFKTIKMFKSDYTLRGFNIVMVYADRAFVSCRTELKEEGITLNCCDANAHVQFVERGIRFIKERIRCVRSMMPKQVKKIPHKLMRELVFSTVKMVNSIRRPGGVHPVMSARHIVTGRRMKLPPYPPGTCVYGVKGDTSSDVEVMRTFDGIYLRPNDEGGGHFVYNIMTQERNSSCRVIGGANKMPLPMTEACIKILNLGAEREKTAAPDGVVFADGYGKATIHDYVEDDEDSIAEDDDKSYETSDDSTIEGDHDIDEEDIGLQEQEGQQGYFGAPNIQEVNEDEDTEDEGVNDSDEESTVDHPNADENESESEADSVHHEEEGVMEDANAIEPEVEVVAEAEEDDPPAMVRELDSDLRDYWSHATIHSGLSDMYGNFKEHVVGSVVRNYRNLCATLSTPQFGFKKGLTIFREAGHEATIKELDKNLIGKNVLDMLDPKSVSYDMMRMSLGYLMFLKRKRDGRIKARGCADGRPQREYISKLESSSPTVKTHALFISCIIDAMEKRKVVVADIPGAFLSADWPDDAPPCYLRFDGVMVDMLCQIDPSYSKLIRYHRNKKGVVGKTLFGKVKKAIYGTLLGAVLFYNKLKGVLIDMGFEMNEYEECTFNKMVDGKQCTIQFHVDDLKLSHVKQGVLDGIIDKLNDIFGSDGEKLAASYGYVHEYLGMTIDWSEEGLVVFTMYDYLEDIIADAPDCFDGDDVTPANSTLFQVDESLDKLGDDDADYFHRTVARFLYAAKRTRPDIQVAISFLCKRVKEPNTGDWTKLGRVIRYVRSTIHLPLVLGSDGSGNMIWSIDAAFGVHMDMRSHTGYCLTLGQGSPISGSSTQDNMARSSTEAELYGVDKAISFVEWSALFLICQFKEYDWTDPMKKYGFRNMVKQDNTSTIRLLKGGPRVCGQRTRNIHIKYFYAHKKSADGTINVAYCPTKEMVSDYLSKPLQGSLFRLHRNTIMGLTEEMVDDYCMHYMQAKADKAALVNDYSSK